MSNFTIIFDYIIRIIQSIIKVIVNEKEELDISFSLIWFWNIEIF